MLQSLPFPKSFSLLSKERIINPTFGYRCEAGEKEGMPERMHLVTAGGQLVVSMNSKLGKAIRGRGKPGEIITEKDQQSFPCARHFLKFITCINKCPL